MNKCKLCECTDNHACEHGCFWIDEEKTICSQCAVKNKVVFVDNKTGRKVIITGSLISNPLNIQVRVEGIDEKDKNMTNMSLLLFWIRYKIFDSSAGSGEEGKV